MSTVDNIEPAAQLDYKIMKLLGFSHLEIDCYRILFEQGGNNVEQLADRLSRSRTGLYRPLARLRTKGFIEAVKSTRQPCYFYAVPIEKGLASYVKYLNRAFHELIDKQAAALANRHTRQ